MLDFGENKSVLVIVPHEDDEINLMGGLLPLLVEKNMDVNICFVTNGDFGSFGIVFLLHVICTSSKYFSSSFPVRPVSFKSTSIR